MVVEIAVQVRKVLARGNWVSIPHCKAISLEKLLVPHDFQCAAMLSSLIEK
jgi:hypothetical protein